MVQGSRQGHHNTHDGRNDGEDDGAKGVIRQGVEDLSTGEDVKANEQDIVCKQHRPCEFVCNTTLVARDICKVAYVLYLRVFHDELVHGDRCDPK